MWDFLTKAWEWLTQNLDKDDVLLIIFTVAILYLQDRNHKTHLKVKDQMLESKEKELKNMTEDRNEYKKSFLEQLKSSKDEIYKGKDETNEKDENRNMKEDTDKDAGGEA